MHAFCTPPPSGEVAFILGANLVRAVEGQAVARLILRNQPTCVDTAIRRFAILGAAYEAAIARRVPEQRDFAGSR